MLNVRSNSVGLFHSNQSLDGMDCHCNGETTRKALSLLYCLGRSRRSRGNDLYRLADRVL
jgi:hypothetical protein